MRSFDSKLTLLSLALLSSITACSSDTSAPTGGGCASGALFCDDFERGLDVTPPSGWATDLKGGALVLDDSQHYSGAKSVKISTQAGAGSKRALLRLAASDVFPAPGNAFYGRMMFRLEAAPTASVHWTLLQAGGLVSGENYHALYRYGGQQPVLENGAFVGSQWMANYETPDSYSGNGPSSDCYQHASGKVIPVGQWSCVEWQFDGPNNALSLWVDGEPLSELDVRGTGQGCVAQPATFEWTAPQFDHLDVGWESYQTDEARTLWLDDIVLDSERIGCPN
jgi:hypothetical protein